MIDITRKGYEKTTLKIKDVLTRVRTTPMGRLLEITSWMLELKDKNVNTEKVTLMIATKQYVSPSIVRYRDFFPYLPQDQAKWSDRYKYTR